MPRARRIDSLPEPATKSKIKMVVLSASRTGTLGLYSAFKILGYKPYHMIEVSLEGGETHFEILEDAVMAENNRLAGVKPYSRADFDKWLAGYDVFIEIGSFIPTQTIGAYLDDPDVKFLLTERDPDRWAKSVESFIGGIVKALSSFPMNILKHFNSRLWHFWYINELLYGIWSTGSRPGQPGSQEMMRLYYTSYIRSIKRQIPPDRLHVIRLEDGLGWEQLCAFTGDPIPSVPYPRGQEHEELKDDLVGGLAKNAAMKLGAVVVPVLGAGIWFGLHKFWR